MRKILFRGRRLDNGGWVYGLLCKGLHSPFAIEDLHELRRWDVFPDTIGQYVGLKDKNGKLIFEGDIVKQFFEGTKTEYEGDWSEYSYTVDFYGYKIGTVVFSGTGTHILSTSGELWIDGERADYAPARRTRIAAYRCEVIGNIYDNWELLKGGDER